MKYLIFTDLDSTLLPESKIIPKKTIRYLNRLADMGHIIVLCTGRPYTGALRFYEALNGKCFLSCDNGTRILKPFDPNFEMLISDFSKEELVSFFDEVIDDIEFALCIDLQDIYGKNLENAPFWMMHKLPNTRIINSSMFYKHLDNPISLINLSVYEQRNKHFLEITQKYPNLSFFGWGLINNHFCYEMTKNGANKAYSVKILQNLLNIPKEQCIAFGDGLNDISMFENVKYSVAMKNAKDEVKQKALYQTKKTSEKEGVRKFLKKFLKQKNL